MLRPHERLFMAACAGMFVFGMILAIPGTVLSLPDVVEHLQLSLATRGTLIAALYTGLLAGSLVSGPIVDAIGYRAGVAASTGAVALLLPAFAWSFSFWSAGAALAAIGAASAMLNIAANALSSDLFPAERGRRMNGLGLMFGVGGLAMPGLTALAAGFVSWRAIVSGGGIVSGIIAIATLQTPSLAKRPAGSSPASAFAHFLRQPGFTWFLLLLACGAAAEGAMAGWTSTFLEASGFTPVQATWVLASHWLGLIVGRLGFASRVDRAKRAAIVRAALGGALGVFLMIASSTPVILAVLPFLIGIAIAIIVPTSMALAGDCHDGSAGTLIGLLLSCAQIGGMVFPVFFGLLAQARGVNAGMSLLVVDGLLIALAAWRAGRPLQLSSVSS